MASFPNSNKLFIENYKILQDAPENKDARPSHNYHTVDLVSSIVNSPNFEKFLVALNIDRSGSMGSLTKDGHTSLQYTLHTVKALIDYLEEIKKDNPQLNIKMLVNAFDDKNLNIGYHEIGKSKDKYLEKINNITPRGTTNIEGAFQCVFQDNVYRSIDNAEKAHILFTDGKPNVGKQSAIGITGMETPGKQVYIGYGANHDSKLLQEMAKIVDGDYHFVDNIENAGMVYGEIIHALLFTAVKDIKINITGAEVYDYKNNTWCNKVDFNSFASEHTQTLILRSSWNSVEPVSVNIIYTESSTNIEHSKTDIFSEYNCTNGESKESYRNIDVEKHMYRQKTMELLSKALNRNFTLMSEFQDELICFEKGLKKFMKSKQLEDDPFMLKLVADIYIAFNGLNSIAGNAFIGSRLTSQANQRAYQVSDLSCLRSPPAISRQRMSFGSPNTSSNKWDYDGADSSSPNTQMAAPKSMRQTSCYTTPSQQRTMRSLTQPIDNNYDDILDAN